MSLQFHNHIEYLFISQVIENMFIDLFFSEFLTLDRIIKYLPTNFVNFSDKF